MAAILLVGLVAFPLLPVAPLPQVDFPTIQVTAQLPGASPETMASSVATPLEYQFAQISGRVADDLDQRARHRRRSRCSSISTATSTRPRRTCRPAIDAAGGQLPKNLPTPPTYRKVNPADSPILILAVHSDVLPLTDGRRLRREHPRPADLADSGHRAGHRSAASRSRRCACRSIPTKIAALGLQLEDVANVIATATVDAPKGSINGPSAALHDLRQRPAAQGGALERRGRRLQERRAGAHPRHRRRGRRAGEHAARRPGRTAATASCC